MSTRATIILTESYSWKDENNQQKSRTEKLYFYRHSDGYPEGTMPSLNIFIDWIKKEKIRDNLPQSAGWLILIGAMEYNTIPKFECEKTSYGRAYGDLDTIQMPNDWKCGAYEPTTEIYGDIEYLYVIDVSNKSIKCFDSWNGETGEGIHEVDLKDNFKLV